MSITLCGVRDFIDGYTRLYGKVPSVIELTEPEAAASARGSMSEMSIIERVARAMCLEIHAIDPDEIEKTFDDIADDDRPKIMSIARAAIAALREPSETMLNAARDWSLKKYGQGIGSDAAIGCWQAMLDAPLDGDGEKPNGR